MSSGGWGSWVSTTLSSTLSGSQSAEPEPESEQVVKTPAELVAELSAEEGEGSQADREALLAAIQGAAAELHADVATALGERLHQPSILVKIKAAELIALLLAKDSAFAAAAPPYLGAVLAEHARYGEGDPKDDSAARVRKAVAESTALLPSSGGAAAEGVPPDSAERGGGTEQASSRLEPAPVDGTRPVEPQPQPDDGGGVGPGEFDSVLQSVKELEADIEQLEIAQTRQASAVEAGQQQLTARVEALDEQLRQVSAQARGDRSAEEQVVAAEAAAALASQAEAQKQQADRLAALEVQMQTMASELSQANAQAESERSRAAAAEERLSELLESHERKLESHEHKFQESAKVRDDFEIATSEALANEVEDSKKVCLAQVDESKKVCLAQVQSVADSNDLLKQTVDILTNQISLVDQALKEATSSASTQLRASVDELSSRIDFIEVQQQAASRSDSFAGESAGPDQSAVETGSAAEALQLERAQTDLENLVQAQTERVSVVEQQLAQQLSDFTTHRQSEQDSRVQQKKMFEALAEMKVESLKKELLDVLEPALEQQRALDARLDDTQRSLQQAMDEQNKHTRTCLQQLEERLQGALAEQNMQTGTRLKQLEDGLVQSKEKRRKELQAEVERLSGEIDEKVSAERNQTVAREAKAAELAAERSAAVSGEIEQLKQGQIKQSEETAQASSERLKESALEFAAVRDEMVQLVQDKLGAYDETIQLQQVDRDENLKAAQKKIFEALREREEAAETLGAKTEELTRHVAEVLRRADDFDESIADHAKTLVHALAESDQRVSNLQEQLQTVEQAHAAAQAALESEAAKDMAEAEAAAAERLAQLEQDVCSLKDVVQSGNAAAAAAAASVQDGLSEVQTQVAQASAAAESAQQTSGGHQAKLAAITDAQQTLLGKVDKQEEIVRLLAAKTMGVEDLSAKKIDKIEKEIGDAVRVMGTKVDAMESQIEDLTTWKQAAEAVQTAKEEDQQARAEQPFRMIVSRCIIRNPAQGKQFVCYQFDVSHEGRAHSFFQRWSAIEKFVREARKELRIPQEIAFPAKWANSLKPEDLEKRRQQLDTFFSMLFGWGERNRIPLLRVPCVQQFLCQDGDLPAPERTVSIPRLLQEHLKTADLRPPGPAAPETPPSGNAGGQEAAAVAPGRVYSSPPGAAS